MPAVIYYTDTKEMRARYWTSLRNVAMFAAPALAVAALMILYG